MSRVGAFFRGGELRGLVIFAVLVAIGWPIIINYARPKSAPPPPPKVVDNRPIEPDTGVAFQGLHDKTPGGTTRDLTAQKILLERARSTPATELDRVARRDVAYTNLWDRPDLYRGVPIHLEGTLLKTLVQEKVNAELSPKGRTYECWFVTPESRPFPYAVVIEDPPANLPIGTDLNERVVVDAYFLRLLGYRAGDAPRAAPLLIGRLRWATDPATGAPAVPGVAERKSSWTPRVVLVVVVLVVYLAFRLVFQFRRVGTSSTHRANFLPTEPPRDVIDPAALHDWLAKAADEDDPPLH